VDEIGVYDAKTHLPKLLERVRRGASLVITRHGVPVARLVPAGRTTGPSAAVAAVREARVGVRLGGDLRAMRDEGRR
jgi:prevent-host-death family protein